MYNILIASKISFFKCKDLLEINACENLFPESLTTFKLDKAIKEITDIIKLQSRGKQIDIDVNYARDLCEARIKGDAV